MNTNNTRLARYGIAAAMAAIAASQAFAANWCPSSSDWNITCNNCTRELTCDVTGGLGIQISGDYVTLDGQGHSIVSPSYNGVTVWGGEGAIIRNLTVTDAGNHGIVFAADGSNTADAKVEGVFVQGSVKDGIKREGGPYFLEVKGSWVYENRWGFASTGTGWNDFVASSSAYGNTVGYNAGSDGSYIKQSYFWGNTAYGLYAYDDDWLYVWDNSFSSSAGVGLYLNTSNNSTVNDNDGNANSGGDCAITNSSGISSSGNSWGSYSGSDCL